MAAISLLQLRSRDLQGPIQLNIEPGECLVLLGAEHSGHLELLQLIAGQRRPSQGQIWIQGANVTQLPGPQRDLAWVSFARPVDRTLSVAAYLGQPAPAPAQENQPQHRLQAWLEPLALAPLLKQPLAQLTEIEFQRVALARALQPTPAILLCVPGSDDPLWRRALRHNLQRLHQRSPITLLYATSDATEAMMLADRIALLHAGRIEQLASPKGLYQSPVSVLAAQQRGSAVAALETINLIPTRLTTEGPQWHLQFGSLQLPFPASRQSPELSDQALGNRDLLLGLRPEHLRLGDYPLCVDDVVTEAEILILELLGAEYQLVLSIGGVQLSTRVSSDLTALTPGLRVPVILRLRYLHLFDARSGKTLSSPPSPLGVVNDDELIMI